MSLKGPFKIEAPPQELSGLTREMILKAKETKTVGDQPPKYAKWGKKAFMSRPRRFRVRSRHHAIPHWPVLARRVMRDPDT